LQHYVAYTPFLDDKNVDALRDPGQAPERILRATQESRTSESPRATLEILCRYREQYATAAWQVLVRGTDRCGPVRALTTVRVPAGGTAPVPVPAPDEAILFSVDGLQIGPLEQVRSLLWKPRPRLLRFGGGSIQVGPPLARVPTLVRVGAAVDYPGAGMDTGAVEVSGGITTDGVTGPPVAVRRPVTVHFYAVRLNAPGGL
jgi:hypothetical protein